MKKDNVKMEDELRPEYDLMSLKVRKVDPKRKSFYGTTVRLETDVAKVFPDSGSRWWTPKVGQPDGCYKLKDRR